VQALKFISLPHIFSSFAADEIIPINQNNKKMRRSKREYKKYKTERDWAARGGEKGG